MFDLFSYLGVEYKNIDITGWFISLLIAISPILFYKGLKSIAAGFSIFIYILVYIPCIHAIFFSFNIPINLQITYILSFYLSMILCFISDSYWTYKGLINRKKNVSLFTVELITILMLTLVASIGIASFQMVNIFTEREDMYELRASSAENRLTIVSYFVQWLSCAFLPYLLITYLKQRKKLKIVFIFISYLICFMVTYQKMTFLLPFIIVMGYYGFTKYRRFLTLYVHSILIVALCLMAVACYLFIDNPFIFEIAGIVVLRTMCVSGWLTTIYIHFFSTNPYTYYSHINIINAIFDNYPYDIPLGRAVVDDSMNANATFWITDGIAALGPIGIIIITIFFILFKTFYNAIGLNYNMFLVFLISIPGLMGMLNVSLFTALLTCGFILLYLLFSFVKNPYLESAKY